MRLCAHLRGYAPFDFTSGQNVHLVNADVLEMLQVGTTLNFSVDTNVAESPTTPTTHYGSAGFLAGLPVDGGSRPLNYSHQPDSYGFEAQGPSEPQFIDERVWSVNHQSQNGYAPIGSSASFDNPYQNTMPRLSGADLAPLNVSSPNTGNVLPVPPPSVDRRLPALSFIGSSTSSELTSPTALVSGRLASLSLGLGNSVRGSIEDARYPHTLNGRQDVMLPPVTREFKNTAPTSSEQTYVYSNMNEDDLYGTCTAAVDPSSSATTVPPLDAMTSFPSTYMTGSRYATIPTSAPTISTMITSDEQSRSRYSQSFNTPQYGWNMANELPQRRTSGTIASGEDRDDGHRYQPIAMAPIAQPQHSRTSPSRRGDKGKEKAASGRHAQNSGTQS